MNLRKNALLGFVIAVVLWFHFPDVRAGRPLPPKRHAPERRHANMHMLRFQEALADERWQEALTFCSDRVRTKAGEWTSLNLFFNETMPIERLLAKDFGCWMCGTNFYGMFITLSDPGTEPRIDWYWGLVPTQGKWTIDYPPVKLDEYVIAKKAAIQKRDERIREIRADLEPIAKRVKTRLTPVSEVFVIGSPMLFQLELINSGENSVHYMDTGVRFKALSVFSEKKGPIAYELKPLQIQVKNAELISNSSVVLADKMDINEGGKIIEPGKYFVQFDSADLAIGKPLSYQETNDRFGENLDIGVFNFLPVTNKFPSNVVEINVKR